MKDKTQIRCKLPKECRCDPRDLNMWHPDCDLCRYSKLAKGFEDKSGIVIETMQ